MLGVSVILLLGLNLLFGRDTHLVGNFKMNFILEQVRFITKVLLMNYLECYFVFVKLFGSNYEKPCFQFTYVGNA